MEINDSLAGMQTYEELYNLVENAEAKLSFWGARYVCVPGYEGTVSTCDLAVRVSKMVIINVDFDEKERSFGKKIAEKVRVLDKELWRLKCQANCLTRIFIEIRALFSRPLWVAHKDSVWGMSSFSSMDWGFLNYYSRKQLQEVFGLSPENAVQKGFSLVREEVDAERNYPPRWKVVKV